MNGKEVEQNKEKAFKLYQKSAEQGYKDAQFQLGNFYNKGIGTEINKTKAVELYKQVFELYKKEAENEDSEAQLNFGCLYFTGKVTKTNYRKAIYWFNKASENGSEVASNYL